MNHYQLNIKADDKQVVLERILQVARYRGFLISGINAKVNTGTNVGLIELYVKSERSIELLIDQINELASSIVTNSIPYVTNITPGLGGPNPGLLQIGNDCASIITALGDIQQNLPKIKSSLIKGE